MNKIYLFTAAFAVMGCQDARIPSSQALIPLRKRPQSASIPLAARWDLEQRLLILGISHQRTSTFLLLRRKLMVLMVPFLWVTSLMTLAEQESTFLILKKVNGIIHQAQTSSIGQLPL